jgi:hypothetical protein
MRAALSRKAARAGAPRARQAGRARAAASQARFMSSTVRSANCPISSRVSAGFKLAKVLPSEAFTHLPSIKD